MIKNKVDEVFLKRGSVVPLFTTPFSTIEELLDTFDKPEELFVVNYGPGSQAIGHRRDVDWIDFQRRLTEKYIEKTGKGFGNLTIEDAKWVNEQVQRELSEMN